MAVVGLRGHVFEGFYQKKLPLRMILSSELITRDNAKQYYVPDSLF
jgi:ribose transport system substrate-binding protein